jgi:hypothetical protein
MNKDIARLALQFLNKTPLIGAEIPAFMAVTAALGELLRDTPVPEAPKVEVSQ